jgi:hypothetical protein
VNPRIFFGCRGWKSSLRAIQIVSQWIKAEIKGMVYNHQAIFDISLIII